MKEKFTWEKVADLVEEANIGITVTIYEPEVEFEIPDKGHSNYLDKTEVTNWEDLAKEIKGCYEDFNEDEYCTGWLIAKRNGVAGIPDVYELAENARYIKECLKELTDFFYKNIFN